MFLERLNCQLAGADKHPADAFTATNLRHAVLSLAYTSDKAFHELDVKKLLGKELAPRSAKAQDLMIKFRGAGHGETLRLQLSH